LVNIGQLSNLRKHKKRAATLAAALILSSFGIALLLGVAVIVVSVLLAALFDWFFFRHGALRLVKVATLVARKGA
jgi:hypothetical protein